MALGQSLSLKAASVHFSSLVRPTLHFGAADDEEFFLVGGLDPEAGNHAGDAAVVLGADGEDVVAFGEQFGRTSYLSTFDHSVPRPSFLPLT